MFNFLGSPRRATLAVAASAIAIVASAPTAGAQEQQHSYNIAAQPLSSALLEFSRQSDLRVMADPATVNGKQAPALQGSFTASAGLDRLLAGSGLTHTTTPSGAILVRDPNSPTQLGEADLSPSEVAIVVRGRPVSHLAERNSTGTRMDADPMTLPMSISTVNHALIEQQQALTLGDAASNVAGVQPLGVAGAFTLRGFSTGTMRNGNLSVDQNSQDLPILAIERLEIVKGPEAIIAGVTAGYGGVVNVITKVPTDTSGAQLAATIGTRGYYDLGADLNYALTDDHSVLVRLIGTTQDQDHTLSGFDGNWDRYIAPSATWRLRQWGTELTAQYEHQNMRQAPADTFTTTASELDDNTPVVRIGPTSDGARVVRETSSVIWNQRITDGWDATLRYTHEDRDTDTHSQLTFPGDGFGFPSPTHILGINFHGDNHVSQDVTKLEVRGRFETGPIAHRLLYAHDNFDGSILVGSQLNALTDFNLSTGVATDLTNVDFFPGFTYGALFGIPSPHTAGGADLIERGDLVLDQMTWGNVIALAGFRQVHYESRRIGAPASDAFEEGLPSLGLLYRATPALSLYASYSKGFLPNLGNFSFDGSLVPSEHAEQYEAGVKAMLFGERIATTFSIYDIQQQNVAVPDPAHPTPVCLGGGACYISVPGVESQGIELEMSGEITQHLDARASISYDHKDVSVAGSGLLWAPLQGSFWLTYNFSTNDEGWWVGAGMQARSAVDGRVPGRDARNPAQTRLDLSGGYNADRWGLVLGVKNVTDERLYTLLSGTFGNATVVQPREWYATLQYRF